MPEPEVSARVGLQGKGLIACDFEERRAVSIRNTTVLVVHQTIPIRDACEHKSASGSIEGADIARVKAAPWVRHLRDARPNRFRERVNRF